eukprot:TRINITY_DN2364_c0_g1_i5.p1 TRINITY_DN2364_c0_g1~~TRINITY_DN2364_c0_g1_i5.p1  ORF type:complete len:219 (-),score=78.11 TRINITY_DN2364_c0_g1_i5:111-767(-)
MGIFFYKNAVVDGDWIIQERLYNDAFVAGLLPESAPLSTMRVITGSRWWLDKQAGRAAGAESIKALSSVFRAGMAGASTDHSSILFDVDSKTGTIGKGTTNNHWYKLGPQSVMTCPWLSTHDTTHHPDNHQQVTGAVIPDMKSVLAMVVDSHNKLLPDVPMVGWDVAMTNKGVVLLEVNLSCNFFRGSFDVASYISMVDEYWTQLEKLRTLKDGKKQN